MPEHILANIDFKESQLKLQMSALSFCLGTEIDIALLEFTPEMNFLNQVEKLSLPVKAFSLDATNKIINPWQITKELEASLIPMNAQLKFPFHDLHEKLNWKAYSFQLHKPCFDSTIIQTSREALDYLKNKQGQFVIKTNKNQSGAGHHFISAPINHLPDIDCIDARLEKWVDRVFDFSTQWLLNTQITCLGTCELINNSKGGYNASIFPHLNESFNDMIQEHIQFVLPIIEKIFNAGFKGHMGIDAFVYLDNNKLKLCPLIEINCRKTMGFVALNLASHFRRRCKIKLENYNTDHSLLPHEIKKHNAHFKYKKNLNLYLL